MAEEEKKEKKKKEKRKGPRKFSLNWLLGGNLFDNDFVRRQIGLLFLIVIYTIIYIANGYASQHEMRQIKELRTELTDLQYELLIKSSELSEKSRQSRIEEYVATKDTTLKVATNPPYMIRLK